MKCPMSLIARTIQYICVSFFCVWFFVCGLVACGDSEVHTSTSYDDGRDKESVGNPGLADAYFLVANGAADRIVHVGTQEPLSVFLYNKKTGLPVHDESVSYEIGEESSMSLASLSALRGTTDAVGKSVVNLRASSVPGTIKIIASHPSANDIEFRITLKALATGDIHVTLINSAPSIMDLIDIDVRLYASEGFSCGEFFPLNHQPEAIHLLTAPTTRTVVPFPELGTSGKYIITGVARGSSGQLAAGGCVEDIRVAAGETTKVEIPLQLIPINPVGRYHVTSHWDFQNALAESGPVGSIIVDVLNIFINPGQALYDGIIDLVKFAVGGLISSGIDIFLSATGLDDAFKDRINGAIEGNDTLRKVRNAGRGLREVVAKLEVTSQLVIGKLSSSYEFEGTDNWTGITLYWRLNCALNAPKDCGAIPLVAADGSDFANLGVLSSRWTGRVVAYNQLQIDTHPLTLRYGRLIIYVLNEIVLPQLTEGNAHSLSEAFTYWVGCDRLATGITGDDGKLCAVGACVEARDIESYCSSTVGTLFGFANGLVSNLEFDVGLKIGGSGTLIELDSNGFVDKIEKGVYEGQLSTTQMGQSAPVRATWEAVAVDF